MRVSLLCDTFSLVMQPLSQPPPKTQAITTAGTGTGYDGNATPITSNPPGSGNMDSDGLGDVRERPTDQPRAFPEPSQREAASVLGSAIADWTVRGAASCPNASALGGFLECASTSVPPTEPISFPEPRVRPGAEQVEVGSVDGTGDQAFVSSVGAVSPPAPYCLTRGSGTSEGAAASTEDMSEQEGGERAPGDVLFPARPSPGWYQFHGEDEPVRCWHCDNAAIDGEKYCADCKAGNERDAARGASQ